MAIRVPKLSGSTVTILSATLLFLTISPVLAFFCPDCGTGNSDEFKFCVKCGRDLTPVRTYLDSGASGVKTGEEIKRPASGSNSSGGSPETVASEGERSARSRQNASGGAASEIDFLNTSGFSDLMKNPGNTMRAAELMDTLQKDPAAMSLFERYKDAGYQSQLLDGLKSVNEEGDPDMDANIRSLEGLFQLLNGMGGGDSGGIEGLFGGSGSPGSGGGGQDGDDDGASPGDSDEDGEGGWGFDGK